MKNIVTKVFAVSLFALALVVSVSFGAVSHAQEMDCCGADSSFDFGGGSGFDFGGGSSSFDFGGGSSFDFGGGYDSSFDFGNGSSDFNFGNGDSSFDFGNGSSDFAFGGGDSSFDFGNGSSDFNFGNGDSSFDFGNGSSDFAFGGGDSSFDFGNGYSNFDFGNGSSDFNFGGYDSSFDFGNGSSDFAFGGGDSSFDFGNGSSDFNFGNGDSSFDFGNGSSNFDFGNGSSDFAFGNGYSNFDFGNNLSNYNPGTYENYNPGTYQNYNPGTYANYNPGTYQNYNPGSYTAPQYSAPRASTPSYGSASTPSYSSPSVSAPRYTTTSGGSYSSAAPRTTATGYTAMAPYTTTAPSTIAMPTYTSGGTTYTTGGTTYVSQPTQVAAVNTISTSQPYYQTSYTSYPQQPVYQQPVVRPAPQCTITLRTNTTYSSFYSQQATLTWTTYNATAASISGIGQVSVGSGTRTVTAYNGQVYTMTVSGLGGTATCQTQTYYVQQPVYQPQQPIVYQQPVTTYQHPVTYPVNYVAPVPTPVRTIIPQPVPTYQVPVTPTPVVVQTPVAGRVSCSISASQTSIKNGQRTTLTWNSSAGVVSASLSDGIGRVAPNGYLAVMPEATRTYVLTVYGQGTSATCSTVVSVGSVAPYVSLSQIPYTGFDFGPLGNAMYWFSIVAFALAAGYLLVYYRGGATQFASDVFGSFSLPRVSLPKRTMARRVAQTRTAKPVAQISAIPQVKAVAPQQHVHAAVSTEASALHAAPVLPTMSHRTNATHDTMIVREANDGSMPRIVISRA